MPSCERALSHLTLSLAMTSRKIAQTSRHTFSRWHHQHEHNPTPTKPPNCEKNVTPSLPANQDGVKREHSCAEQEHGGGQGGGAEKKTGSLGERRKDLAARLRRRGNLLAAGTGAGSTSAGERICMKNNACVVIPTCSTIKLRYPIASLCHANWGLWGLPLSICQLNNAQ